MNNGVRSKDKELRYLEIWDKIRKRVSSDLCEVQEVNGMLENLKYYSELAKRSCRHADRELYDALYCVLREKLTEKKKQHDASKFVDASCTSDSGFGTHLSEPSSVGTSKKGAPQLTKLDVTPQRPKRNKRRSHKILLPNSNGTTAAGENVSDVEVSKVEKNNNSYPFMATAIICCLACFIALAPHRFFPWVVTRISFNSPPPL